MNPRETLAAMKNLENHEGGRYWLEYTLADEEHWRFTDWAHPLFPIFEACCLNLPKAPKNISKIAVGEWARGLGDRKEEASTDLPITSDTSSQIAIGETEKGRNLVTLAVILITPSLAELKILDKVRFAEFIKQSEMDKIELEALQADKNRRLERKEEPDYTIGGPMFE